MSERECLCKCVFTIFLSPRCYKPYANYSCRGFQYAVLKKIERVSKMQWLHFTFPSVGGFWGCFNPLGKHNLMQ